MEAERGEEDELKEADMIRFGGRSGCGMPEERAVGPKDTRLLLSF